MSEDDKPEFQVGDKRYRFETQVTSREPVMRDLSPALVVMTEDFQRVLQDALGLQPPGGALATPDEIVTRGRYLTTHLDIALDRCKDAEELCKRIGDANKVANQSFRKQMDRAESMERDLAVYRRRLSESKRRHEEALDLVERYLRRAIAAEAKLEALERETE